MLKCVLVFILMTHVHDINHGRVGKVKANYSMTASY